MGFLHEVQPMNDPIAQGGESADGSLCLSVFL